MEISRNFLSTLATKHHNLKTRHANLIAKGEKTVEQVGKTLEIGGSAFVMGAVNGRTGGVEVFGVPLDLGLGVLGHIAGFALVSERNSHHVHNISDGILATFGARMGESVGQKWKATGKLFGHGGAVRGLSSGGESITDDDLARLAAAI